MNNLKDRDLAKLNLDDLSQEEIDSLDDADLHTIRWGEIYTLGRERKRRNLTGLPVVKINRNGSITFTSGFLAKAKDYMKGEEYVTFHYSEKLKALIFETGKSRVHDYGRKLVPVNKGSNYSVSARDIFRDAHIDPIKYEGRYEAWKFAFPLKSIMLPDGMCWAIFLDYPVHRYEHALAEGETYRSLAIGGKIPEAWLDSIEAHEDLRKTPSKKSETKK